VTDPLAAEHLEPLTPGRLRRLLASERLRPRKSLSQNFLTDPGVLDSILEAADLHPGQAVVEIGPGLGVLTRRLLAAGARVLAVELDARLAAYLRAELAGVPTFVLLEGDALAVDPDACFAGESFMLVANIPYHITSPLLHRFLEAARPPTRSVLLVQLEVAQRVAAPPGQMSYLSVFVQNIAAAVIVRRVPAEAFEPAPAVDSAILRLDLRESAVVPPGPGRESLHRLAQAGFRQRRKQLHNALGRELPLSAVELAHAFDGCGIDPERRAQTLSVAEWACLADRLHDRLA